VTTFADVLVRRIREDPGRPLVTYYDLASGERVELSVTTYANWVAKTASLLGDEHGLERGAILYLDLPLHWLGPVFLGAAWTLGLQVTEGAVPDAVVTGPEGLRRWAPEAGRIPVLACALLPLGVRFADPLPPGVHDVGVEVWSQPDAFTAWDPPTADDAATDDLTQADLWGDVGSRAAAGSSPAGGDRLLSTANPASPSGLAAFTEPLLAGGSLVLVSGAGSEVELASVFASERCTGRFGREP
jgi:uncharacterized protein (TIGR03089 family)